MVATRFKVMASVIAATAILSSGMSAYADSVNMTYTGVLGGKTITGTYGGMTGASPTSGSFNTSAGLYTFNVNSTSGGNPMNVSAGDKLYGVCVDITHAISTNTTANYDVVKLSDSGGISFANGVGGINASQITAIAYLWDAHYANVLNGTEDAAVFQMAVWNILYNKTGVVWADNRNAVLSYTNTSLPTQQTQAYSWADVASRAAVANPNYVSDVELYAFISNGTIQSFAFGVPGNVVPLPAGASMGLTLLGSLGGIVGLRNLRRRSNSQA